MERVLHVALKTKFEKQPALANALRDIATISSYDELDWQSLSQGARADALLKKAKSLSPTLVFMQLQNGDAFSKGTIQALRDCCPSEAVIVNWDGDQHFEPLDNERRWFAELGKVCDASLVTNTKHPAIYAAMGVKNPGYLQIGIDPEIYKPSPPTHGTPEIVMLASRYGTHAHRNALVEALAARYGSKFAVYGTGWSDFPSGHPMLTQREEAGAYAAARCAISMSIRCDLPHYTSDRLFRAMASGAVVLVEEFPGFDDLVDVSCTMSWITFNRLTEQIDEVLASQPEGWGTWRQRVSDYAHEQHTWAARMPDLLDIVERVRADR